MNKLYTIIRGLAVAFALLPSLCAFGQDEVMHSSLFGVGESTIYDSFLSPQWYTGTDLRFQCETMRMTSLMNGRIHNQSLLDINADINSNPVGNIDEYAAGIRYSQGWFYNFGDGNVIVPNTTSSTRWNYAAGLQASAYLGGVYINRSGNNPGQAKADVTIDASAMVTYDMHNGKYRFLWRYQMSVPMIGVAFSPNFGQSYYEIFVLKNYDHNILFAYPGNMPSFRSRLSIDVPLKRMDVRFAWALESSQARFNNLRYNNTSQSFMIGFNKYFFRK